jgi:hypothetical protein
MFTVRDSRSGKVISSHVSRQGAYYAAQNCGRRCYVTDPAGHRWHTIAR